MAICVVYWLYNETCSDPRADGYIGYSSWWETHRIRQHINYHGTNKSARLIPSHFEHQILFRGTVEECKTLESALRPESYIGWNLYRGGGNTGPIGYKHTAETRAHMSEAAIKSGHSKPPKSVEWRAAMSAAAINRYNRPGEKEKTQIAVKEAFKHIDRTGANNGRFGKPCSEATKQKIREVKAARRAARLATQQQSFDL